MDTKKLDQYHLLKHTFYQKWQTGELSINNLKYYAVEYFKHVDSFPRYISTIHSLCDNIETRQILLGNLIEEEQGPNNHPELWLRFAEGLELDRETVKTTQPNSTTAKLVEGYFKLSRSSFPKGIGALYAYERQIPEVATSKIEGLRKFYGINDDKSIEFFTAHISADEWHSQECLNIIKSLSPKAQQEAEEGALEGAKLLWKFLDGVEKNM